MTLLAGMAKDFAGKLGYVPPGYPNFPQPAGKISDNPV
jgi:hypothetical protein